MTHRASLARRALLGFGFFTAFGLFQTSYRWLDRVARLRDDPVLPVAIEEFASVYGTLLLLPAAMWWTRRVRRNARSALAAVAWHLPAFVVFSLAHTSWNAVVRAVAFQVAGLGTYDYGAMPARYAMEASIHVLLYLVLVSVTLLYDARIAAQEREARYARIETELAEARMRDLQDRLRPHFLFNALNTISSVMYADPAAADTMLARLADLLRRSLRAPATEVPLGEELETVRLWLSVMEARFGDRIAVRIDLSPSCDRVFVPPLLLQPLLENALKHGEPPDGGRLGVVVSARRERLGGRDALLLEVEDDGPGLQVSADEAFTRGVGLSTTRQRLETLHGEAATIRLDRASTGGLAVRLTVPWREAVNG